MRESVSRIRSHLVLFMLSCAAGCIMLAMNPASAHALFTTDVHLETAHAVQAFPTELSVDANGYRAWGTEVDRDQIAITATFSDGTTRVLENDEYELSAATIPAGHKGEFETEVMFKDVGHEVWGTITVNANEAYGAQYGDVLVFGRGIPASTYNDKQLSNTTWGIEDAGCSPKWNKGALTSVVDIDTVKPVSMSNWFNHSGSVRSIVLDQMDTSQVTDMSFMFYYDTALTTLDVSKWNMTRVRTIMRMFSWCTALPTLNLSAWKTDSLTTTELAFNHCAVLTTTGDLSGWNMANCTSLHNMFDLCYKLKSIGNVNGWNTSKVTDMDCVFANCYEISVNCSNWNVSKVTTYFDFRRHADGVIAPVSSWT